MLSPDQLLARALAAQQAGRLQSAVADYRALMALLPQEPAPLFNAAVALNSPALCRRALRLVPELVPAHLMLGDCRRAWILDPGSVETANNYANSLQEDPEAASFYRRALRLDPFRPEAYGNFAACLLALGHPEQSRLAGRTAAILAPGNAETWNNLGNTLYESRDYQPALGCYRRARLAMPAFAEACLNEGGLRLDLGQAEPGAALSRLAVVLAPDRLGCYNNLANGELLACRLESADAVFRRAIAIAPDDAQTRFNHAAVLLKQGRMQEGWAEYEWRRRTPAALRRRRSDDPPDWPGGDPKGRTLLLSAEQGYGDVLQFYRFVPWLQAKGAKVILRTHPALSRLMGGDQTGTAEFHLPLMSVPAAFKLERIPAEVPYLAPDPRDAEKWRRRLDALPGRKVGLVWSGDPRPGQRSAHLLDRRRSMRSEDFDWLRDIPGVSVVSLQHGEPEQFADFADTAALIAGLDLVISVDTAVAHLAGALGKPVYILSRFDGCWRWLQGRSDSPWYPTARLFRQVRPGDWSAPLEELKSALNNGWR
jgi:tetratricopeptide (TPR) repeat protein